MQGVCTHRINRQSTTASNSRLSGQESASTAVHQKPPSNPNAIPATQLETPRSPRNSPSLIFPGSEIASTSAVPPLETIIAITPQVSAPATAEDNATLHATFENGSKVKRWA